MAGKKRRSKRAADNKLTALTPTRREPGNMSSPNQTRVADFTRELRTNDVRVTHVSQWADYGVVTSTSGATGAYAYSTVFTDFPDNSSYSSTYDQYKIIGIEYHIIPCTQPSLPATSPAYSFCHVFHDYDDANTPGSLTVARSYPNLTILGPGEKHIRRIKPRIAVATTTSATSSINGAANMDAPWMDMISSSVPHYGLKIIVSASTSTNLNSWYVFAKLDALLRAQR